MLFCSLILSYGSRLLASPSERVRLKRSSRKGMIISYQADGLGVTDVMYDLDAIPHLLKSKAASCKNLAVALVVQLGKARTKLKFLTINVYGAVSTFLALYSVSGK